MLKHLPLTLLSKNYLISTNIDTKSFLNNENELAINLITRHFKLSFSHIVHSAVRFSLKGCCERAPDN